MFDRLSYLARQWGWMQWATITAMTAVIVVLVVLLRSIESIWWFAAVSDSPLATLSFVLTLLGGLVSLFSPLMSVVVVVSAFLFSINVVLFVQYIRQRRTLNQPMSKRATAANLSGVVATVLGIGCASCGTAILFAVLSVFGASSLLLWLPLHGEEFAILGMIMMAYVVWYLLGKLSDPLVCDI